jgi:hypothetical protein
LAHGIAKEVKWKRDGELEGPRLPSWIRKITRRDEERTPNREECEVGKDSFRGGRVCEGRWEGGEGVSPCSTFLFLNLELLRISGR